MKPSWSWLACLTFALAGCGRKTQRVPSEHPATASAVVPVVEPFKLPTGGSSIYALGTAVTDQNDRDAHLDVFAGHPVIISMFYGSCPAACPMLVHDIQKVEERLDPPTRKDLRVLLVSFDPQRDSPAALKNMAGAHGVDEARWKLARTSSDEARALSAVLGIQYRHLETGEYAHTVVISVLDRKGVIVAHREGLEQPTDELVQALQAVELSPAG